MEKQAQHSSSFSALTFDLVDSEKALDLCDEPTDEPVVACLEETDIAVPAFLVFRDPRRFTDAGKQKPMATKDEETTLVECEQIRKAHLKGSTVRGIPHNSANNVSGLSRAGLASLSM